MGPRPSLQIPETVLKQKNDMSGESNYTKRYYDKDVTLSCGGIACPNHLIQTLEKMTVLFFPYRIYEAFICMLSCSCWLDFSWLEFLKLNVK
jgi:hypothetical protein